MAVTVSSISSPSSSTIITNTDVDESVDENMVPGAGTVQMVEIDNTANASDTIYVKLFNLTTSVTFGTTAPSMILPVKAAAKTTYSFPIGIAFDTGISIGASKTAGSAGGAGTGPDSAITVRLLLA